MWSKKLLQLKVVGLKTGWFNKGTGKWENAVNSGTTWLLCRWGGAEAWLGWGEQWDSRRVTTGSTVGVWVSGGGADSKIERWSLLWALAEGWPLVVGSMSERPCHAVTISGFFWSAKFFQIRNAPSSGERGGLGIETERYREGSKEPGQENG